MSGGGKRGSGAAAAPASIPAGSRKMVQSLKEIVNCPEAEIYATLKECNMDPSEAVHRLLTQGKTLKRFDLADGFRWVAL